jgi:hypothetical protein
MAAVSGHALEQAASIQHICGKIIKPLFLWDADVNNGI